MTMTHWTWWTNNQSIGDTYRLLYHGSRTYCISGWPFLKNQTSLKNHWELHEKSASCISYQVTHDHEGAWEESGDEKWKLGEVLTLVAKKQSKRIQIKENQKREKRIQSVPKSNTA